MNPPGIDLTRRQLCTVGAATFAGMLAGGLVSRAGAVVVSADHGRVVPPVPVPPIAVRCADGRAAVLSDLVRERATALHLMFTGCSTVCPIQGAIFQRVQDLLADLPPVATRLISLSIDPLSDTPAALQGWLQRFGARDPWIAAAPRLEDLPLLQQLFGQGRDAVENHATQVSIIDRSGELVFKTQQLPSPEAIAALLRKVQVLTPS